MKKFLFLAVCILLAFTSCKKSSETPPTPTQETIPPGITATIDGTPVMFNALAQAYNTSNGVYQLSIVGRTAVSPPYDELILDVMGSAKPTTGTYQHKDGSGNDYAAMVYDLGTQTYLEDYTSTAAQHPVTIKVTVLTSTNAQGTFSGQLVLQGVTATGLKVITDGKFNVNF